MTELPQPVRPLVEFPGALRANGFAVSPDQTIGFVEAIGLLGPRDINDVRSAALAMLAIPHERLEEFDAIFRAFFLGEASTGVFESEDPDVEAHEATGNVYQETEEPDDDKPGEDATTAERLARREFESRSRDAALLRFSRLAPARLPRRKSYRHHQAKHGRTIHFRNTLRQAAKQDGEIFNLTWQRRRERQRRIVLLIDISGSMAERTDDYLRFAHTLARVSQRFEAFTLGTRLTRISIALRRRNADQALSRISSLVADIDGGTRIGEALQAFLSVPRYAGFARGALVLVLSDGLERGEPNTMVDAVARLSRIAWRLDWISPLAFEGEVPATAAMSAIRPYLDALVEGNEVSEFSEHLLSLERSL